MLPLHDIDKLIFILVLHTWKASRLTTFIGYARIALRLVGAFKFADIASYAWHWCEIKAGKRRIVHTTRFPFLMFFKVEIYLKGPFCILSLKTCLGPGNLKIKAPFQKLHELSKLSWALEKVTAP